MFPRKIRFSFCLHGSGVFEFAQTCGCKWLEDNFVSYLPVFIYSGLDG